MRFSGRSRRSELLGRGRLRVRPRSAAVVPGLGGADEGLIPLGDLGGALVADLARLDAHRGVRKASPAGGSPSSAARAAPPLRRAQPVERDTHIPCRDACDADVRCGRSEIIRGAAETLGTLPRTSFSGAGSTNTLDMLPLGPSHKPHAPVDWIGRENAAFGLDLRSPGGSHKDATRPTAREAAVATTTQTSPES